MPPSNQITAFLESQQYIIDPTNPRRTLDDGIEDRLHVCRRATDDAEHFGCRCLMLQRLAQFCVALLDLFEQADVFDGDYGLVCEGFEQIDLLIREWPNLSPTDQDGSDRDALAQQRSGEHGSSRVDILLCSGVTVFCIEFCQKVVHMNGLTVQNGSANWKATTQRNRTAGRFRHIAPVRCSLKAVAKHAHDHSVICLTQTRSISCHHI